MGLSRQVYGAMTFLSKLTQQTVKMSGMAMKLPITVKILILPNVDVTSM